MIRPEIEALLQGALDDSLTPDERSRLARLLGESREARERAAELQQLTGLIDSLGAADAPPDLIDNVLSQLSQRPHVVRPSTFQRGVTVNKKILFGLAAAAAIVLAVITYNSNPPATEGTEATIGAAQRAQTPQLAAQDVKLGDTSAQDVLQTEEWDAILKDETLRTMLQDASFRQKLGDADLRKTLTMDAVKKALNDPELSRKLNDEALARSLNGPEMKKFMDDASLKVMLSNQRLAEALRDNKFRELVARHGAALAGEKFQRGLRNDRAFDAAIKSQALVSRLAGSRSAK